MSLWMRIKTKFDQIIDRVFSFLGFFVAPYRENYVYVEKYRVTREKIGQKKTKATPVKKEFNTFDDEKFFALAERVIDDGRTYLGKDRLFILWQVIRNVAGLQLPVAEVGTFRGGSAYFIASAFRQMLGEEIPFHVIDTFEGHPDKVIPEIEELHFEGKFSGTDFEFVREYLSDFKKLEIHKGEFSEVAKTLPLLTFGFVHVDVDIYKTTGDCLEYFAPKLSPGGIMVLDDFSAPTCPGVDKAVTEFLRSTNEYHAWHPLTEQIILVKK